jgi:signal transduction histidine kinase
MMRGRFLWRFGILFVFMLMMVVMAGTAVFWLAANAIDSVNGNGPLILPFRIPVGIILALAVGVMILSLRTIRRAALPVANLLEAAGRVKEGDYTVRVSEGGPREVRILVQAFNDMVSQLEVNEAQRRNLLADVTHELRTPLTIIQGNLEGLLDGIYPRDDAHLTAILEETRVFARLVEDLRTLAQAESGTLKLQRESTDPGTLLREAVSSFTAQADLVNVKLEVKIPDNLPIISVDPVRIRAVLSNLIINALRYTSPGGSITTSAVESADAKSIIVSVTDDGKGIPDDVLPHIFDRFYKSLESRGSGLGLAIARYLVNAHGGSISAKSEIGKGATVTFTLPVGE